MRKVVPVVLATAALLAAPGVATADVIFDPADADELAAVLTEATQTQDVCYGWQVEVDDAVAGRSQSVGSDRGAGTPVDTSCAAWVRFNAYITYTSESSESEDSSSWDLTSSAGGPTTDDMGTLEIDFDELTGENPDVVIGKAVSALPLLAADKGLAAPIVAAPESGEPSADAALTDDPGSDWWRESGGMLLWGLGLLLGGGVFAWWVVRTNRRYTPAARARSAPVEPSPYVPDTVPAEFYQQNPAPKTEPIYLPASDPAPKTEPIPAQPKAAKPADPKPESKPTEPEPEKPTAKPAATEPEPTGSSAAEPKPTGTEPADPAEPAAPAESAEPATGSQTPPAGESTVEPPAPGPSTSDSAAPDQKTKE